MARFVEVLLTQAGGSVVGIRLGDILYFHTTGGRVREGAGVVKVLGHFSLAVATAGGQVLTPEGLPSVTLFHVLRPGRAVIELAEGGALHTRRAVTVTVVVEAATRSSPGL